MSIDNATPTQWDNAKKDMVDHPPHYNKGGLECIEGCKHPRLRKSQVVLKQIGRVLRKLVTRYVYEFIRL